MTCPPVPIPTSTTLLYLSDQEQQRQAFVKWSLRVALAQFSEQIDVALCRLHASRTARLRAARDL